MTGSAPDRAKVAWAIAENLNVSRFENVALSLVDLHRTRLRAGESVLSGVTFVNCRIEGPAVMLPLSGCNFDRINFGYSRGDIRNLVLRPASPNGVIGAIGVQDCKFIGGEFFAIGFTGEEAFLDQILALGNTMPGTPS
jgi:hypothetical protein